MLEQQKPEEQYVAQVEETCCFCTEYMQKNPDNSACLHQYFIPS